MKAIHLRLCTFLACAGLTGLGALSAHAQAEQIHKIDYGISLAGLPLGTADLTSHFTGLRYDLELEAKLTGLAGLLTGGRGEGSAKGAVQGLQPSPSSFALLSRSSRDEREIRMGMAGGIVNDLQINPPIDEKPDRIPLTEGHKRGVVDPISALVMPALAKGDLLNPANCNRSIPVFDGAARYDINLTFQEKLDVDKPGYKGPVLVCNVRYVPLAGHRALRPATKFMEENKDMQVWLAPLEPARVLLPLRIAVRTMIGMSVVEAFQWGAEPVKVAPSSDPTKPEPIP